MPIKVTYREARRLFAHGWEIWMYNANDELVVRVLHEAGSCRWAARRFNHKVKIYCATGFMVQKRV